MFFCYHSINGVTNWLITGAQKPVVLDRCRSMSKDGWTMWDPRENICKIYSDSLNWMKMVYSTSLFYQSKTSMLSTCQKTSVKSKKMFATDLSLFATYLIVLTSWNQGSTPSSPLFSMRPLVDRWRLRFEKTPCFIHWLGNRELGKDHFFFQKATCFFGWIWHGYDMTVIWCSYPWPEEAELADLRSHRPVNFQGFRWCAKCGVVWWFSDRRDHSEAVLHEYIGE